MTVSNLSKVIGVSVNTISKQERNELSGNIKISTMQNYADKLWLNFVYWFSHNWKSLEDMINDQAWAIAENIVKQTLSTMHLEWEIVNEDYIRKEIYEQNILLKNNNKKLWK